MTSLEPKTVLNIHAAKTHFSKLVERAEHGESTVIARNGKPVALLVPYRPERKRRVPGVLRGQIKMGPAFDEADEEIARLFGIVD